MWYLRTSRGQSWIGEASVEGSLQEGQAGPQPVAVAATTTDLYVLEGRPDTDPDRPRVDVVERLDPATLEVVASVPIGALATDLAADENAVWVITVDGTLLRLDPQSLAPTARVQLQGDGRGRLALGAGRVWVVNGTIDEAGGSMLRIHGVDPRTAQETLSRAVAGSSTTAELTVGETVWVATGTAEGGIGRAFPVAPDGVIANPLRVPTPVAMSQDGARVWWASLDGRVGAFAPNGASGTGPLQVGPGAADLVLSSSLVWVASEDLIVLEPGPW